MTRLFLLLPASRCTFPGVEWEPGFLAPCSLSQREHLSPDIRNALLLPPVCAAVFLLELLPFSAPGKFHLSALLSPILNQFLQTHGLLLRVLTFSGPDPGWNPCPLQWKGGILTTGPPAREVPVLTFFWSSQLGSFHSENVRQSICNEVLKCVFCL